MDANGQRFYLLAQDAHWKPVEDPPLTDFRRSTLRLASRAPSLAAENVDAAMPLVELVPGTRDTWGTRARWSAAGGQVLAAGAVAGEVPIYTAPAGQQATDVVLGWDGVLYVAFEAQKKIVLSDRRGRWPDAEISFATFQPWRLAANPAGGVWALDRKGGLLGRLHGLPLRPRPYGPYAPDVFRPNPENFDPPRFELFDAVRFTAPEQAVALAASPDGRLAVLSWSGLGNVDAAVRFLDGATLGAPVRLNGSRHPYSLTWAEPDRLAVLCDVTPAGAGVTPAREVRAYAARPDATSLNPVGDFYPLQGHDGGPFLHGLALPAEYPTAGAGAQPLNYVSMPSYERRGSARNAAPIDSGDPRTVWHRLYLEAAVPPNTEIDVWLAATDDPAADPAALDYFPHRIGGAPASSDRDVPRGAWLRQRSELAFHDGLLPCAAKPGQSGLFTALIQRAGRRVRALRGRFLHVRAELSGDGRSTPELAALRAWASRFSYRDRYLPRLYHETVFGPDADAADRATPADFLDRYLANFEGVLTQIEDRIRFADLLTDARTTPADALPWLGGFIGFDFDPALPEDRRRAMLENAPDLYKRRGTLRGLEQALDLATGGMVSTGTVVVLEDWRLRRTFATILGARLDVEDDPLLPGLMISGNSYVGDTLFLGEETNKEFLALFRDQAILTTDESEAVQQLFERLAHRVTIFVHQALDDETVALIKRVVEAEKPAHVDYQVVTSTEPFLVGLASLLGVDTYLRDLPPPKPVTVGASRIGVSDYLDQPASLDPRIGEVARADAPPVAQPSGDLTVPFGQTFALDGSRSTSPPGDPIIDYRWTLLKPN
ncbi:MAG TPA: phage tail protein [Polyangia bacterium]|nr:phage tail protein [Polyangia bacterium]